MAGGSRRGKRRGLIEQKAGLISTNRNKVKREGPLRVVPINSSEEVVCCSVKSPWQLAWRPAAVHHTHTRAQVAQTFVSVAVSMCACCVLGGLAHRLKLTGRSVPVLAHMPICSVRSRAPRRPNVSRRRGASARCCCGGWCAGSPASARRSHRFGLAHSEPATCARSSGESRPKCVQRFEKSTTATVVGRTGLPAQYLSTKSCLPRGVLLTSGVAPRPDLTHHGRRATWSNNKHSRAVRADRTPEWKTTPPPRTIAAYQCHVQP